jgi:hypothetical protein
LAPSSIQLIAIMGFLLVVLKRYLLLLNNFWSQFKRYVTFLLLWLSLIMQVLIDLGLAAVIKFLLAFPKLLLASMVFPRLLLLP